jgi:ribosomal protein S18 acetylase RimI-like enzyme
MNNTEFDEMMKLTFGLIKSHSDIQGAEQVDLEGQVKNLLPDGLESEGNYFYSFFDEEDHIVGYAWCVDKADEDLRLIAYIGVKKEYQRKGYGLEILKTVCNYAKQDGIKKMILGVEKTNLSAYQLYLRQGFYVEGEEGEEGTRYIMLKEL